MRAFLVASSCLGVVSSQSCEAGITLKGRDTDEFDGDYLLDWLFPSHDGGRRFGGPTSQTHVDHQIKSIGEYTISPGCLGLPADNCNDLDASKSKGKWVFYQTTTPEAGSSVDPKRAPTNRVVAFCTSGCPAPKQTGINGESVWPASGSFETTWELTGEQGKPGNMTATLSCCKRKAQKCDGYSKCPSHNTPLGIFSPSCNKDPCCKWEYPADIAVGGKCVLDPATVLTSCDHSPEVVAAGSLLV